MTILAFKIGVKTTMVIERTEPVTVVTVAEEMRDGDTIESKLTLLRRTILIGKMLLVEAETMMITKIDVEEVKEVTIG